LPRAGESGAGQRARRNLSDFGVVTASVTNGETAERPRLV
jgi:hypothetical protein